MRKATKTVSVWLGVLAGLAGLEHGYFEILQGSVPPPGFIFPSMGPPCIPAQAWSACEAALTILPNLRLAGILTVILGLLIILWSIFFIQNKYGGHVLITLSSLLLLSGGGVFPPLFGIIGGIAGIKITKPLPGIPASFTLWAGKFWPWPLVLLVLWPLGQYPVGYFFNDFMKGLTVFWVPLLIALLPLSVYCAYAYDADKSSRKSGDIQKNGNE